MLIHVLIPIRVGSQRLPKKHLLELEGTPIYSIIYENAKSLFPDSAISFCIPDTRENDIYEEKLRSIGANIFRGDDKNVLKRLQDAASKTKAKYVARLCGDNVFFVKDLIAEMLIVASTCNYKIITNGNHRTFPKGCTFEIIDRITFLNISPSDLSESDCEHVFPFFYRNIDDKFIKNFKLESNLNEFDLSVDDPRQINRLSYIWKELNSKSIIHMSELSIVCKLLNSIKRTERMSGKTGPFCMLNMGSFADFDDIRSIYVLTETVRKLGLDGMEFNDEPNTSVETICEKLTNLKMMFQNQVKIGMYSGDLDRIMKISKYVDYICFYCCSNNYSKLLDLVPSLDSQFILILRNTSNELFEIISRKALQLGIKNKIDIVLECRQSQFTEIAASENELHLKHGIARFLVSPNIVLNDPFSNVSGRLFSVSNIVNRDKESDIKVEIFRMEQVLQSNIRRYTQT